MKYYITQTEKKIVIGIIVFYIILNLILCFKGMKIMSEYKELEKEKEALEDIIQIQKERIQEIEWLIQERLEEI